MVDLLVTVPMHQSHVSWVISRRIILVEDDVMSFERFAIGEQCPTYRAAEPLLSRQPMVLGM